MRGRLRQEDGFTLVELMMVTFMMTIVIVVFTSVFENLNEGVARQQERSRANDEARLAIEQLDREIRSGNVLYDPEDDDPQFYTFRIHSQANATTRTSSPYADPVSGATCVQWWINGDQELVRRVWQPGVANPAVSDWRVVAEHVVNRVPGIDVPAFTVPDPDSLRTVAVTLMVDVDTSETVSRPVRIETSLTGRNTTLGSSQAVCGSVPSPVPT